MGKSLSKRLIVAIIGVLAFSPVLRAADWYHSHCDGNEYGDFCIDITVDSLRAFASTSGSVGVNGDGWAHARNWISGGVADWEDEDWGYVEGFYNGDYSLAPWCGTVHATGDFWYIDTEFTWHLVSGWEDSDVGVNTGFCY